MTDDQIIIDVDIDVTEVAAKLSQVIQRMNDLKKQQAELSAQIKAGNDVNGEAAKLYAQNESELARLKVEQKEYTSAIQQQTGMLANYGDSLNEMRRKLKDMQSAYDSMSKAMRESASGQQFLQAIKEQDEAVKELEASTGRHQRNVGNYPKVVTAVIPGFERITGVLSSMGVSLDALAQQGAASFASMGKSLKAFGKMFITPPIIIITAILGAILFVIDKISEAFKKNDDAGTNLQRAYAALQPIVTAVGKVFDKLAVILSEVILAISKMAQTVMGAVASLFGLKDAYDAAAAAADELVQAQDRLEDAERNYTVNSAKRNAEIAELRAKAAEKEKYTAAEREQMLQNAIDLEKKNLEDQKSLAEQRLKNLEREAKQNNDTSDEMKNKLAQALAEQYKAEEAYSTGVRNLNKQLQQARSEQAADRAAKAKEYKAQKEAEAKAAKEAAEAEIKAAEEAAAAEQRKAEIRLKIQQEVEDAMLNRIADATDRALAAEALRSQRELQELRDRLAELEATEIEARENLNYLIELKTQEHEDKMREINMQAWNAQQAERAKQIADADMTELDRAAAELELKTAQYEELLTLDEENKAALFASETEYLAAVDAAQAAQLEANKRYDELSAEAAKKAAEERKKIAVTNAAAVANVMGSLSQVLDQFAEENKAAAIASKAIALGQIAVQTGIAIAEGVAAAAAAGPPPANLIAIATTIATVMANIATAIATVKSAKFAEGGVVGGNSYSGDKIMAFLNSGEVVLNKDQAATALYQIVNGTTGVNDRYDNMTAAFGEALQEMPQPVLAYEEFTTFEQDVAQLKEFARV